MLNYKQILYMSQTYNMQQQKIKCNVISHAKIQLSKALYPKLKWLSENKVYII
jgi:hypothetical protein